MVNLERLTSDLEQLAEECRYLGTPFTVRRSIKDTIKLLPQIADARDALRKKNLK